MGKRADVGDWYRSDEHQVIPGDNNKSIHLEGTLGLAASIKQHIKSITRPDIEPWSVP